MSQKSDEQAGRQKNSRQIVGRQTAKEMISETLTEELRNLSNLYYFFLFLSLRPSVLLISVKSC